MLYRTIGTLVAITAVATLCACPEPVDLALDPNGDASVGTPPVIDASNADATGEASPSGDGGVTRPQDADCFDCRLNNTPCTKPSQCCSQQCVSETCIAVGCRDAKCGGMPCHMAGVSCHADNECCSNKCTAMQCVVVANTCLPPGEACDSDAAQTCCSGGKNCIGGRCDLGSAACAELNGQCVNDSDCCGNDPTGMRPTATKCVSNGDGGSSCYHACHNVGDTCTTKADCCGSYVCDQAGSFCVPPGRQMLCFPGTMQ